MATKWTDEQKKVIETRHRNLLVSAAAGSGKTAVLVERIIRMITVNAEMGDVRVVIDKYFGDSSNHTDAIFHLNRNTRWISISCWS